jgi:hypothetical protein
LSKNICELLEKKKVSSKVVIDPMATKKLVIVQIFLGIAQKL